MEIPAKRFRVSGKVQGVGFRYFVEGVAARLGIAGYVKNLSDGSVEVYAIGDSGQMEALKNDLLRGPRMARVDQVTEANAEALDTYANDFSIEGND